MTMQTLTTEQQSVRRLALPQLARLREFMTSPGPALLLTTSEPLPLFRSGAAFGEPVSLHPGLGEWPQRAGKLGMSAEHALRAFPADPEQHALLLERGSDYPREQLPARPDALGAARDRTP